jgi:dienelactone hydrolase
VAAKVAGLVLAAAFPVAPALAQSAVTWEYELPSGLPGQAQGVLRIPTEGRNGHAMLLLHHSGGFDRGTTAQYAALFQQRGFLTLELRLFDRPENRPVAPVMYAMTASALMFLSRQPGVQADKVSAIGLSMGAFMAIVGASSWFYAEHNLGDARFHKLAALYPVCWSASEISKGHTEGLPHVAGLPSNFLQSFAGVPLLILAAGRDDYDGRNPRACLDFAASMRDTRQSSITQVKVYAEASHGWDHGRTYDFMVWGGCVGRTNCRNRNVHSPEHTERGKQDLLAFFSP